MTMTTTDVTTIAPFTHDEAMRLQAHELERLLGLLRSLDDAAWTAATDCPAWDVRAMCQHVLGVCEAGASMRENVHQMRRARSYRKQQGGPLEAALSAVQVRERAQLTPAQVVERLSVVAPKTVRGRTRVPALARYYAKLKVDGPVYETWKLGYLVDTIYLRDLWMHRVDVARASGPAPGAQCRPRWPDRRRHSRRMGSPSRPALRARAHRARRRHLRTVPAPLRGQGRANSMRSSSVARWPAARQATGLLATIVPF